MKEKSASLRTATVEAKREFVEIIVKMLMLNATLKRTKQPPLKQRGDCMHARHEFVSLFRAGADHCNLVWIARFFKSVIAPPSVGMNNRTLLNYVPDELQQAAGG